MAALLAPHHSVPALFDPVDQYSHYDRNRDGLSSKLLQTSNHPLAKKANMKFMLAFLLFSTKIR